MISNHDDLYPFAGCSFEIDGVRSHYLDEGAGDPVVMVHGNPTWSFFYRELVQALQATHRCIVPDHIGCGRSDKPRDYPYTLRRRVDDLERLLDRLEIDRGITLVLHDWGGMIGMAYASRHPERVQRLVIFNTAAFHLPPGKKLPWSLRACRVPGLGAFLVRGLNLFCRGAARYCTRKGLPVAVRRGYLEPYDSYRNRLAVHRFILDIPLRPRDEAYAIVGEVEENLDRLTDRPMLILWGERDFVFDDDFLAEWRRRFPAARVRTFPEAGHYLIEDVGEEIVAEIRDFLAAPAPETVS